LWTGGNLSSPSEVDDDPVRDVTELLRSLFARLYGRRSATNRARRAVEVALGNGGHFGDRESEHVAEDEGGPDEGVASAARR
jgi:beta-phosphoglucomutase-like phosphatase (HAD superfamily)